MLDRLAESFVTGVDLLGEFIEFSFYALVRVVIWLVRWGWAYGLFCFCGWVLLTLLLQD